MIQVPPASLKHQILKAQSSAAYILPYASKVMV